MNTVSEDDTDDKRRRWRRLLAVIAAVAVLAVVLVVAGGALLGQGTGTTAAPARVPPAPAPASPPAAASRTGQVSSSPTPSTPVASPSDACPAGLVSDVLPASAPADVVWRATPMAPVPYSKTWGPYRTTASGLPRCFSHSPTGAVIAARSIDAWLVSTQWRTVLATQVARTPGYSDLQSALASDPPAGAAETDTVVGFNIAEYTPGAATIDLVVRSPNSAVNGCAVGVRWADGDWQLTPRPDGTLTNTPCPTADTGTYVPWGPNQ